MTILKTSVLGIEFENPFLLASAPPTAKIESIDKAFSLGWGGAVLKTITPDDLEMIEASTRYASWRSGAKVCGFENIEMLSHLTIQEWLDGIKYLKQKYPTKVQIASIMAPVVKEEWQKMVKTFNHSGADAFELNFSCPHGMPEKGIGMAIGTHADLSAEITKWVKEVAEIPVFVKLSPNVTNIVEIAKAVEDAGADGLAAINTVQSLMGIDLESFEPLPKVNGKSTFGGYSGMAVKPIGLRCVAQLRQHSKLPILGMGGISTWSDAAEYMTVGADVVQVCTEVMINGYGVIKSMTKGLGDYLIGKGFNSPAELRDKAIANLAEHKNLYKKQQVYPDIDADKCVRCGKCVMICDESEYSALSLENGKIEVNRDKCIGCSLCSHVCPMSAISMKK
ncbi:MAG: NAD-dependent dihydropyrimidine dehydrogenase subunit PreA [Alphaproteobacteria bacterium]|nr:NAD-dependent dihydropyrimidine dehydrogenase subunit PreA [Alphaproteobacteria bacterium]